MIHITLTLVIILLFIVTIILSHLANWLIRLAWKNNEEGLSFATIIIYLGILCVICAIMTDICSPFIK